jgi:hypothetical protein
MKSLMKGDGVEDLARDVMVGDDGADVEPAAGVGADAGLDVEVERAGEQCGPRHVRRFGVKRRARAGRLISLELRRDNAWPQLAGGREDPAYRTVCNLGGGTDAVNRSARRRAT